METYSLNGNKMANVKEYPAITSRSKASAGLPGYGLDVVSDRIDDSAKEEFNKITKFLQIKSSKTNIQHSFLIHRINDTRFIVVRLECGDKDHMGRPSTKYTGLLYSSETNRDSEDPSHDLTAITNAEWELETESCSVKVTLPDNGIDTAKEERIKEWLEGKSFQGILIGDPDDFSFGDLNGYSLMKNEEGINNEKTKPNPTPGPSNTKMPHPNPVVRTSSASQNDRSKRSYFLHFVLLICIVLIILQTGLFFFFYYSLRKEFANAVRAVDTLSDKVETISAEISKIESDGVQNNVPVIKEGKYTITVHEINDEQGESQDKDIPQTSRWKNLLP